jgi:hypothetical protein
MNKEAIFQFLDNYTPWDMILGGAGVGAGTFGVARLLADALQSSRQKEDLQKQDGLTVDVPAPAIHKRGDYTVGKLLGGVGGAYAGFSAANQIYKSIKNKQLQSDVDSENKKRLQLMQQFKTGSATPLVDMLCEGISENINKEAHIGEWLGQRLQGSADVAKGLVGDVGNAVGINNDLSHNLDVRQNLGNSMSDDKLLQNIPVLGSLFDTGKSALGILLAAGAGGTGMMMYNAHKKKEEAEQGRQYPDQVNINPVRV